MRIPAQSPVLNLQSFRNLTRNPIYREGQTGPKPFVQPQWLLVGRYLWFPIMGFIANTISQTKPN